MLNRFPTKNILPVFSDWFEFGDTNFLTLLLLEGAINLPSPLDAFFGTFLLQLPLGDERGNVCADIGANLFRGTKGCRLSAKSLGWAAWSNVHGIGRDGKGQNGKGKGSHFAGFLRCFQQKI